MTEIKDNKKSQGGSEFGRVIKANLRDYMMYIVLVAIIVIFSIASDGKFVSANNISNLFNQAAYVAVLAIGMTIILILKHIDLSVGYVAGFSGAVCALMLSWGISVYLVIPAVLLLGLIIGLYQGFLVTRIGVPAFVTTLAGMFIFRGLLGIILKQGTVVVKDKTFNALNNGFIPDVPNSTGLHLVTMIIGAIGIAAIVYSQVKARKNKKKYGFKVVSTPGFIAGLVLASVAIMTVVTVLAKAKGIPWSAVIVAVILLGYSIMLNKTRLGRYIYGIGGNDQAAELSGVNVKNVTMFAFCSMSVLAAVAGILYTSRLMSASPQAGNSFEMDAIASSYIGGVAVSGGVGKVTNTIIGTLVIMSLTNGMNLLGIDAFVQYIVKGVIFIIAVAFDVVTRKKSK